MRSIALDARLPLAAQGWQGLNSPEHNGPWARRGGRVDRADGSLRWGLAGHAFLFRIAATDPPLPDGTRRCEAVAYAEPSTALPVDQDFWFCFRFFVAVGAGASDAVCLTQWHQQGGPPLLALYLQAGRLSLSVRHGSGGAAQTTHLWQSAVPVSGWQTLVLQARIGQPLGLLRAWVNGALVAQHAGPLGHPTRPAPYTKAGLYWWPDRNPWDAAHPERTLLVTLASILVGAWGADDVQQIAEGTPDDR